MAQGTARQSNLRFGSFELDLKTGELVKEGKPVKLQPQPSKALALLVGRAGQLVTREELRQHIWGRNTFVDVDKGINYCLRQIRIVLGDDVRNPSYIETLPRRGYRFIKAVHSVRAVHRASRRVKKAPNEGQRVALAVLPFRNLSSNQDQEYFADGMTDALVADLAKIAALRVISRTSVMRYKRSNKPLPEIAHELKVDVVVEGSVLRSKDRIRITAQLVDGDTDQHLWAETYERDLRDILSLQSEVARAVAGNIKIRLTRKEQARLASRRSVNPAAYQLYLRGRFHWNRWTQEGWQKSINDFEAAVRKDPTYAPAYAALADSYNLLGSTHSVFPPRVFVPKAKTAAAKALEIDDSLAEGHASLALAEWWSYKERLSKVEDKFRQAIRLNPSYSDAYLFYSWYLAALGRFDESLQHLNRARDLDPLSLRVNTNIGWIHYLGRQYDQAIAELTETLQMDPNFSLAYLPLGCTYIQLGSFSEAITALRKAAELSAGSPLMRGVLAHAYAKAGKKDSAMRELSELQRPAENRYVPAYEMCIVYAGLGNSGQAVDWLEKALGEGDTWLSFIEVEPLLDGLRDEPEFKDVLHRIHLCWGG